MDSQIDLDALRATLMAMRWGELREVATRAGLSPSTVDKIRRNLSKQPSFQKINALAAALHAPAAPRKRKAEAA